MDGAESLWFRYRVIRLWEIPVKELLSGDVSLRPLAPVADVAPDATSNVIERMEQRLADIPSAKDRSTLWTATYLLMGLKFTTAEVAQFLQGIAAMKESSTYQAIVDEGRVEGRVEEANRVLLKLGSKKFGPASPDVEYLIQQKTELDAIESLLDRLIDVTSWDELLGTN